MKENEQNDYKTFCDKMKKIVEAMQTPCFVCSCGEKTWMYEGVFEYAYKTYNVCKCGQKRILIGDDNAPEL